MSITVYWISGSAPAWRTLLFLEFKNLKYESRILETSKKEQKEPWFLEINPRGQIPVVQDGDTVVTESLAIMHYLEKKQPEPSLFGSNPKQTAQIEQASHEILSYVDTAITGFVNPVFRNKIEENRDTLPEVTKKILNELEVLENRLENNEWLAGEFSAADIVMIPTMQRLIRAMDKAPELAIEMGLSDLSDNFPNLMHWNSATELLEEFDATFPPHWRN